MTQASPRESAPVSPPTAATGTVRITANLSWTQLWCFIVLLAALVTTATQLTRGAIIAGLFPLTITFFACLVAAWYDAAYGRVPNSLTYTGLLLGLGINLLAWLLGQIGFNAAVAWLGVNGPADALLGFALSLAIAIFCVALPKGFSGMGMGDLKLLAALGMLLGFQRLPNVLLCALVAACIYGILNLMIAGRINLFLRSVGLQLISLVCLQRLTETYIIPPRKLPLGIPLFLGVLCAPIVPLQQWLF